MTPTEPRDNEPDPPSHRLRTGVLDPRVLDDLAELQTAADPHFLSRVITLYLTESPKLMAQLKSAVDTANTTEAVRAAHSLKSSSANLGALAMSVLCAELVAAGRDGRMAHSREIFVRIEPEQTRVIKALGAELARRGL